jgi:hypothetical protein
VVLDDCHATLNLAASIIQRLLRKPGSVTISD